MIKQLILGSLLGDASITKAKSRSSCRFEMERKIEDIEYLKWFVSLLEENGIDGSIAIRKRSRTMNGYVFERESCRYYSKYKDPIWRELRAKYYPNDKKTITPEYIKEITPLSIAVWYMDDGSYDMNRNTIQLRTDSFSKKEHHLLINMFKDNYKITPNLARDGKGKTKKYYLYFPREEAIKLLHLIKEYILPCMERKMPLGWDKAICLPAGFHKRLVRTLSTEENAEILIKNLNEFYIKIGSPDKFPVVLYNYTKESYSFKAIHYIFGSWKNALEKAGLPSY